MNCPNCDSKLTCGCQKAKAADGATVCVRCVDAYNQKLNNITFEPPVGSPSTAPSNVKVLYTPPRKIDSL